MKKLLVLGSGDIFEQAVAAWSEPEQQVTVTPVELAYGDFFTWDIERIAPYPPAEYECFAALSNHALNLGRLKLVTDLKLMKYRLPSYISPRASVSSTAVIGDACYIADGAVIGAGATVKQNTYIGPRAVVGQGCKISHSVWLDAGVLLGPRVQIGNNTTLGMGIIVHGERKIGSQCEITRAMEIMRDIPSRTFYHPMFETEVRIWAA